ncbi:MAG: UDP-N-acetylmuramate--L-alanine ligase [Bacilli bacterium]|nr:UDP-N-acetylmuramate--L-alanine ligase [Bacilli bacterium]
MKYYCIGIKGSGMSTLAQILYDLGNEVIGYDDVVDYKFTEDGLRKRHIPIYHSAHDLPSDIIVTYSAAFSPDHKEIKRINDLGLKVKKYHDILGDLTKQFESICVCGTHGKTTTSTLISHVLGNTLGCNYFIGDGSGFASKNNNLFVIESCEYNRHFLAYHPTYSIITNIELEHTEVYKDIDEIIATFKEFALKSTKGIIACGDDLNIRKLNLDEIFYYGFNDTNDIYAKNVKLTSSGSQFEVILNNESIGNFDLPLFGEHMVLNTLACIAICIKLGIKPDTICKLLKTFHNAKRRFHEEVLDDVIIIDDYAHHPTEIEVTLKSARQKYPNKKIVALFKPNTYSRTKDFYNEFASALNIADYQFLTEIDCNRETQEEYPNVSSKLIFDNLKNGEMIDEESVDKLLQFKDSVIVFMSCASVSHLIENYKSKKTKVNS